MRGGSVDERTVKRAKARLGIEHRRTQTFPAATEWRRASSQATVGTSDFIVPTVPTLPSANGRNPLQGSSEDTQDTQDTENKRPQWVPSDAEAELDRLKAKFPDIERATLPSPAALESGGAKHEGVRS